MIKTIYVLYDDDSYEVEVNADTLRVVSIWRYLGNRHVKPEICQLHDLSQQIQDKINDKLIRTYGEPHNGEFSSN